MHLVILNHINEQSSEPGVKLKSDVMVWKDVMHNENELTRAILATVIFVAENCYRIEHYFFLMPC